MGNCNFQFRKVLKLRSRRLVLFMGMIASMFLVSFTFSFNPRYDSSRSFPASKSPVHETSFPRKNTSNESLRLVKLSIFSDSHNTIQPLIGIKEFNASKEKHDELHDSIVLDVDGDISSNRYATSRVKKAKTLDNILAPLVSSDHTMTVASVVSSTGKDTEGNATSNLSSTIPLVKNEKIRSPIFISTIDHLLIRNRASDNSMRPRWSSACDEQISSAKEQIENSQIVNKDQKLFAPLYKNISMFKRSYELMEKTLMIYVYKEGEKPIFHQPLLKGIYSSEGWFMKLMETNRHFVVKDPRKAHLFYIPLSSRYMQLALYKPELSNRADLEQYLKNYVNMIIAKYPFWNRTRGADHFLVACHDWAPSEIWHTMEHSIRVLCTADPRSGFLLGRDVSLPQTNVRFPHNPLKGLGGGPHNRRPILAFFSGSMHGSLRPILLRHWENKDPTMKISEPLPTGSPMSYAQYMKSSKFCICPRGHEGNSPRVVESILYECVPVIISDNYVLPFFEVLNWAAFSVIVRTGDVARLKEILESIPEDEYAALQKGVRKVQQHFLWRTRPVKYDLFHMVLHSIWFNRLYQLRHR